MRSSRSLLKKFLVFAALVVVAGGVGVWLSKTNPSFLSSSSPSLSTTVTTVAAPKASLEVLKSTPSATQDTTTPSGPFEITFNEPIDKTSLNNLQTSQPGSWSVINSTTASFTPAEPIMPQSELTIKSPSSSSNGILASNGDYLSQSIDLTWKTGSGSVLRIQQILAQLGYLPLVWTPTSSASNVSPIDEFYNPPSGNFSWRYANTPASLKASFQPGVDNNMTKGAMIAFERSRGIPAYGSLRPLIWPALLSGEADGIPNKNGYTYAIVSKVQPETLTLWNDGDIVLKTLANTGIAQTPTPNGTFYVYLRYPTQTMRGKNVNGSYYVDHGVKWVNYIDGSVAIHGFVRASYGFPQSLGCVELPVSQAAIAWKWLHYGSLVYIS